MTEKELRENYEVISKELYMRRMYTGKLIREMERKHPDSPDPASRIPIEDIVTERMKNDGLYVKTEAGHLYFKDNKDVAIVNSTIDHNMFGNIPVTHMRDINNLLREINLYDGHNHTFDHEDLPDEFLDSQEKIKEAYDKYDKKAVEKKHFDSIALKCHRLVFSELALEYLLNNAIKVERDGHSSFVLDEKERQRLRNKSNIYKITPITMDDLKDHYVGTPDTISHTVGLTMRLSPIIEAATDAGGPKYSVITNSFEKKAEKKPWDKIKPFDFHKNYIASEDDITAFLENDSVKHSLFRTCDVETYAKRVIQEKNQARDNLHHLDITDIDFSIDTTKYTEDADIVQSEYGADYTRRTLGFKIITDNPKLQFLMDIGKLSKRFYVTIGDSYDPVYHTENVYKGIARHRFKEEFLRAFKEDAGISFEDYAEEIRDYYPDIENEVPSPAEIKEKLEAIEEMEHDK